MNSAQVASTKQLDIAFRFNTKEAYINLYIKKRKSRVKPLKSKCAIYGG